MTMYCVSYEILSEARTDSFMGSGSSYMSNLTTTVEAISPNQARDIVEARNGGHAYCRTFNAFPI